MRLFPLLIAMLLAACGGSPEVDALLAVADSLSGVKPDSALRLLQQQEAGVPHWSKAQRMRGELLRARAMNKAYVDFTTDSIIKEVADYYDRHGTPNQQVEAHYLLGCAYRDLGEAPRAIDAYQDAIARADTTATDCDYHALGSVYAQMAKVYHQQLLFNYELEAHQHASYYNYLSGDTLYALYEQKVCAGIYLMQNRNDSAESILHNTIRFYRQQGYVQEGLQASTLLMHLYIEQGNRLSELKELIDQYEQECTLFDEQHILPPRKRQFYYYKGKYYETLNLLDSAEYYYRMVHYPGIDITGIEPMYKGLLSVFTKRHQADSIAKYATLYCAANDSSIAIKDRELTAQLAASYDYHYYKTQSLENENKALWAFIAFIITFISLIALVVGIVFLVKHFRNVRFRLYTIHLKREEELRQIHQLEKEELQRVYYHKQEQARLDYEQQLARLKSRQEEELTVSQRKEMCKRYFSHEVVLRSIHVANDPKQYLTEKAFNDLLEVTYEHFPVIRQEFDKTDAITVQMKRVCVLTILDVHVDDIGRLLKVSPQRITNIRAELSLILFSKKSARKFESNLRKHFGIKKV